MIDADALIEAIEADMKYIEDPLSRMFMEANISDIRHMTTIEPERKTGRWERVTNSDNSIDFRCSACHRYRFHNGEMRKKYKFCPNCGARMSEGEEDA